MRKITKYSAKRNKHALNKSKKYLKIPDRTDLNDHVYEKPFPVDVFPQDIQSAISATNASLQFPNDFSSAAILYAVSVAIGNTVKVKVKEGWFEKAVIYTANVGRPGTNKSHPYTFFIYPIIKKDSAAYDTYKSLKAEYDCNASLSKKERKDLGIDLEKPNWSKFLVADITPEALANIHSFNRRGLGMFNDELASWFKNFNRYNKGSEQEFWLSNWSGKVIIIDRKSGEPVFISEPFISVAGTIQNGVLHELAKERTNNGFIDRILFAFPDNLQKTAWTEKELNDSVKIRWSKILSKLLKVEVSTDDKNNVLSSEVISFSPQAYRILSEWQKRNTDLCNQTPDENLSGVYSKLEIYVIRLALILHMLKWACGECDKRQIITSSTVRGAIKMIEYFRSTAEKVHSLLYSNPTGKLPEDKKLLYSKLPAKFLTKEALQIGKSLGIPRRNTNRFITDETFFINVKHGHYEKRR